MYKMPEVAVKAAVKALFNGGHLLSNTQWLKIVAMYATGMISANNAAKLVEMMMLDPTTIHHEN